MLSGFVENLQNDDSLRDPRLVRPLDVMAQQAARMPDRRRPAVAGATGRDSAPSEQEDVDMGALLRSVADDCRSCPAMGRRSIVKSDRSVDCWAITNSCEARLPTSSSMR